MLASHAFRSFETACSKLRVMPRHQAAEACETARLRGGPMRFSSGNLRSEIRIWKTVPTAADLLVQKNTQRKAVKVKWTRKNLPPLYTPPLRLEITDCPLQRSNFGTQNPQVWLEPAVSSSQKWCGIHLSARAVISGMAFPRSKNWDVGSHDLSSCISTTSPKSRETPAIRHSEISSTILEKKMQSDSKTHLNLMCCQLDVYPSCAKRLTCSRPLSHSSCRICTFTALTALAALGRSQNSGRRSLAARGSK